MPLSYQDVVMHFILWLAGSDSFRGLLTSVKLIPESAELSLLVFNIVVAR